MEVRRHLPAKRVTPGDSHYFFGYFDRSPWAPDGTRLLAHRSSFTARQPRFGEPAEVGTVEGGVFTPLAETRAWCWQLGSHLQWLDGNRIIFNDVEKDRHVSRILDLQTGAVRTVDFPVYCISPDRKSALSVNFSRLDRERPGYGYPGLTGPTIEHGHPDFDSIWRVDLEKNSAKLILPLQRIVEEFPANGALTTANWFNHLLFSPDGERFGFIHRYRVYRRSGMRFYVTRLFTARSDGTELWELPVAGHASHYTWPDAGHLIAHCRHSGDDNQYHLFRDRDDDFCETIARDRLPKDGHCSFSPRGRWLLTDSYPNANEERTLHLFDTETQTAYEIGAFKTDVSYPPPTRCDLHPRWSPDGNFVCIDSIHENFRGMYVIDVREVTDEN